MPRMGGKLIVENPMGGLDERHDSRAIGNNALAKADNVYNRNGLIAPKPGYREVIADSLGLVIKRLSNNLSTNALHIAVDAVHGYVFWTSGTDIYRLIVSTGVIASVFTASDAVTGIDVDTANSKLYFCETVGGKIRSCNLDGSSAADVYTGESGGLGSLRYDSTNGQLYWQRIGTGIRKAPLSPGSASTHISNANAGTLTTITGMAVSATAGKLVWKDSAASTIKTAAISAADTSVTTVLTSVSGNGVSTDGTYIFYSPTASTINRALLDGTSPEAIVSSQSDFTTLRAFAYNATYGRLFFNNNISPSSPVVSIVYSVVVSLSTAYPVVTEWFRRSILGVDASSYFCKDIVWAQIINTTNSNSEMNVLFPSLGIQKAIQMGYHAYTGTADGNPTIWATDDRDSDPTYFDPFSTSSARCSFAYTGRSLNRADGGWKVAQDGIPPRMMTYVLSDTIWTYTETDNGGPSTGLYRFNFNNYSTTQDIPIPATAAQVTANLLEASSGINGLYVTKSGSTFTIRLHGVWSGKDTPTLTITKNGGSGALSQPSRAQTGGLDTAASGYVGPMVYCKPCGLPTPPVSRSSSSTTSWYGDQITGTPALDGVYNYRVSYYSSRFNIESPLSDVIIDGSASSDYIDIDTSGSLIAAIRFNTAAIPTTLWWAATPFRHIDKVRLYRRRWGDALSGGVPDGVGADDDWYFVQEADITLATTTITLLDDGDPALNLGIRAPSFIGYPPDDAKFAVIHKDRMFYPSGDHNIWFSELDRQDSPGAIELGHEYVGASTDNFIALGEFSKHDYGFTAGFSFADRLMVADPEAVFSLETSGIDFGEVSSEKLRGAAGIANGWAAVDTESMPDLSGYRVWLSPRGHIYLFDGVTTQRISQPLLGSVNDIHRKFWNDPDYFETGLATTYYASVVLWPDENVIILSLFDKSGTAYNLAYNIEMQAWSRWDTGGFGFANGRLWTGTNKGKDIVVFGKAGGKLYYLDETASDGGSAIATDVRSKRYSLGSSAHKKGWKGLAVVIQERSVGSADPNITLSVLLPTKGALSTATTKAIAYETLATPINAPTRTVQAKVVHNITASGADRARNDADIYGFALEHDDEIGSMHEARDSAT